jgi:hypothetical protein
MPAPRYEGLGLSFPTYSPMTPTTTPAPRYEGFRLSFLTYSPTTALRCLLLVMRFRLSFQPYDTYGNACPSL